MMNCPRSPALVIPRACGVSSTLQPFDSIAGAFGILDHPPSRMMTAQGREFSQIQNFKQPHASPDTASRSRRAFARHCERKRPPHPRPSYPAQAGYPVRRGLSVQSLTPLEYWVARSSRAMTSESVARSYSLHISPRSRGVMRPSFGKNFALKIQRAQGMPGARCTRSLACK
jgi:hypothetical protein